MKYGDLGDRKVGRGEGGDSGLFEELHLSEMWKGAPFPEQKPIKGEQEAIEANTHLFLPPPSLSHISCGDKIAPRFSVLWESPEESSHCLAEDTHAIPYY